MKKVWIAQNISRWVSIDLDEIESFHYEGDGRNTHLFIDNKRIVKDVEIELFCALEGYLVNRFSSKEGVILEELLKKIELSNDEMQEEEA